MRTVSKFFTAILSLLITATSITACSKKADEPQSNKPNRESNNDKLVIADLKIEIKVTSKDKFKTQLFVVKGLEPNIYRDGKLASQGPYSSPEQWQTGEFSTTISHRGAMLFPSLIITKDLDKEKSIINLTAKLYRNGKIIQEYNQEYTLTEGINGGISESFQLYGNEFEKLVQH